MRTTLHLTIAFLLLHLSITVNGQNNSRSVPYPSDRAWSSFHFADPSDSTDFLQFIQSLRPDDGPQQADGSPKRYRQVWRVSEHGGLPSVMRGDGQVITLEVERPTLEAFDTMVLHMRIADGRACVVRLWERPCAMICRTTEYYLEE